MIHVPAPDAFAVFGLPRTLDVDTAELERRYLELSRECHPDLNRAQDTGDCIAVLQRSAEINDAWQVLRDPWRRARALLEAEQPGVLQQHQRLDPSFLTDALELAEAVAEADAEARPALRERLTAALAADFDEVQAALRRRDLGGSPRRVHQAHYHLKALRDLEARA